MFEPGMKMFRVRLTRNGVEAGTYVLPAFDVEDATSRAKTIAAQSKEHGDTDDNPFDNLDGLEAWVRPIS